MKTDPLPLAQKLAQFFELMEKLSPTEKAILNITKSLMDALETAAGHLWDAGHNSSARMAESALDEAGKAFEELAKEGK